MEEGFRFQATEDLVSRCWIFRMALGDRHVEERITIRELALHSDIYDFILHINDRMQRRLLRDQQEAHMAEAREIIYEITLREGFDPTITARRSGGWGTWGFGSVQETIRGGVISNAVLENYKCILRRRLEERERTNAHVALVNAHQAWVNSWRPANYEWNNGRDIPVGYCNDDVGTVDGQINGLGDLIDLPREEQ